MRAFIVGSFDPITNGHLDLIKRAYKIFGNINILILQNIMKKYMFDIETRVNLIKEVTKRLEIPCEVHVDNILMVDCVEKYNIDVLIRGIRNIKDFEYENIYNKINRSIKDNIEYVYLLPTNNNEYISSTMVRELIFYNSDISKYVPEEVVKKVGGI